MGEGSLAGLIKVQKWQRNVSLRLFKLTLKSAHAICSASVYVLFAVSHQAPCNEFDVLSQAFNVQPYSHSYTKVAGLCAGNWDYKHGTIAKIVISAASLPCQHVCTNTAQSLFQVLQAPAQAVYTVQHMHVSCCTCHSSQFCEKQLLDPAMDKSVQLAAN